MPGMIAHSGQAGAEGVALCRVQHRAPAVHVRVAQADETDAGGCQHRIESRPEEARHDERRHGRQDLDGDDVDRRSPRTWAASRKSRLRRESAWERNCRAP